jgi:hypothetical protein
MRGGTKVMPPIFFSENVTATTVKFTWMIHISFEIIRLFFHKASFCFNTLLPTLSKTLYTNVVKFPTSTWEHIMSGRRRLSCDNMSVVCPNQNMKDVLLLHDNTQAHTSLSTCEAIAKVGWNVLPILLSAQIWHP